MEHHNVDDAWYDELVTGVPKPLMDKEGFIPVPDGPGLGIELNEDAIKKSLKDPAKEYFAPTPEWDKERAWDRLPRHAGETTCLTAGGLDAEVVS
jgi:hypothetical protein